MFQIVMEYCAGGSISDIMTILGKSLNEEQIAVVTHYVLLGLKYLHSVKKIRAFSPSAFCVVAVVGTGDSRYHLQHVRECRS